MTPGLNIWLTRLMGSLLDALQLQMLLWYSILRTANIMSWTATGLIHIVSLAWSILLSNTTGASTVLCYKTIIQPLRRSILPGRGLNGLIRPRIRSLEGWSWIFHFPVSASKADSLQTYTILFDNGTTASEPLNEMASLIPPPPVDVCNLASQDSLLPPFLHLNSKITFEHEGQYHEGFLGKCDGCFHIVFKSHVNKQKEDWSVPLPNPPVSWVDLCVEGVLLPGHVLHTFL